MCVEYMEFAINILLYKKQSTPQNERRENLNFFLIFYKNVAVKVHIRTCA